MQSQQLNENDQNALSRQIAVFGMETQRKFMHMKIFIHGMTALGVQVAKNIIMMDPKSVTLYDLSIVTLEDVRRNFYCQQKHIGKSTRAQACIDNLQLLNSNCNVQISLTDSIQFIKENFDFVIFVDHYDKEYLTQVNLQCRKSNIGFTVAGCLGLYGYVFNDFGQHHIVQDPLGQQIKDICIQRVAQGQQTLIYCEQFQCNGFSQGDYVQFKMTKGMTELNDKKVKINKIVSKNCFQIGDTQNYSPYRAEGTVKKIIQPFKLSFKSFQESFEGKQISKLKTSEYLIQFKETNYLTHHFILEQIYDFFGKNKRLPKLLNIQETKEIVKNVQKKFLEFCQNQNLKIYQLNENLIKNVVLYAETQITPVCSFFGGLVAQQVVKFTGKFTPINQWFHYDFYSLLQKDKEVEIQKIPICLKNKFNDYAILFGNDFLEKCQNLKIFLIGAGSLGGEILKNLSMMGVAQGDRNGQLNIVDGKCVKKYNLNSNFLFQQKDSGNFKVNSISKNIKQKMNKNINLKTFKYDFNENNEQVFNDDFWFGLDLVINAADNTKTINQIDERCVWYEKPLISTAMQGLGGRVQVVLPYKTSTITDIQQVHEQYYDSSTVVNFPYKIQHLIQWAISHRFTCLFIESSQLLNQFYSSPEKCIKKFKKQAENNKHYISHTIERLQKLKQLILAKQQKSFEKCVEFMIEQFQQWFVTRVERTVLNFPHRENNGQYQNFWTGLKRKPQPLFFDIENPSNLQFINAGANIYADILEIPKITDPEQIKVILLKVYNDYQKNQHFKQENRQESQLQSYCLRLFQEISLFQTKYIQVPKIIKLDLQDPNNGHLLYIHAAVNLRTKVYRISPISRIEILVKSRKVVPKVVTTSAMTAGLTVIEIIKFIMKKDIKTHTNSSINLALPQFVFFEPSQPIRIRDKQYDPVTMGPLRAIPGPFTKWDKIDIKKPMLLIQLFEYFKQQYNVRISGLVYGKQIVYCDWFKLKSRQRLVLSVEDAISQAIKKKIHRLKNVIKLQVMGETEHGDDCVFPQIRYFISKKNYEKYIYKQVNNK